MMKNIFIKMNISLALAVSLTMIPNSSLVANGTEAKVITANVVADYRFDGDFEDESDRSELTVWGSVPGTGTIADNRGVNNTVSEFGQDENGTYWRWESNQNSGGGFRMEIDEKLDETYTIGLKFSFSDIEKRTWNKIIDYENRNSDAGFYFKNGQLNFFPLSPIGSAVITSNTVLDMIVSRDSDGTFSVYLMREGEEKQLAFTVNDGGLAVPFILGDKTVLGFFHDDRDYNTSGVAMDEAPKGGQVYSIKVWDGVVDPDDVIESLKQKGKVIVSHQDEQGNVLEEELLEGYVDTSYNRADNTESYTITNKEIEYYEIMEVLKDGESLGTDYEITAKFTLKDQLIVYRYKLMDTDGDGFPDKDEVEMGSDPLVPDRDTDGDGIPDSVDEFPYEGINLDLDGDGIPDINIDLDGDGVADINVDLTGDGIPNINIDITGDKKADVNIDIDGDDKPDINIDTNNNNIPDINIDTNGDGYPDVNVDTDGNEDGLWKPSSQGGNADGIWKPDTNVDIDGEGEGQYDSLVPPIDLNGDGIDDNWNPTIGNESSGYETMFPDNNIDLDGDGIPDINIDLDGDGVPDLNVDTDGDLTPDVNIDLDGDGTPDLNVDTDGDFKPDVNIEVSDGKPNINVDTDGDLIPDINIDLDGDGVPDLNVDTDGDLIPDINIDLDGDGVPDLNVDTDGDLIPDVNIDINGDGRPNINVDVDGDLIPDINIDIDGDLFPDINIDIDGDLIPDKNLDTDNTGVWKPSSEGGNADGQWKVDETVEEPEEDTEEDPEVGKLTPDTGDNTKYMLYLIMCTISALGCVLISNKRRKNI